MTITGSPDRLARAYDSLEGLSVGDAFGERFFFTVSSANVEQVVAARQPPAPPWDYTDDTQMALSIVSILRQHNGIEQEHLARSFAERFMQQPGRGYGPAMHRLLPRIHGGASWHTAAYELFGGQGSFGNGAAMRVAPLGAFFADDLDAVVTHAQRSAEVTHAHPEGIAGAIAVALAAAHAVRLRGTPPPDRQTFLDTILPRVPDSKVAAKIQLARNLEPDTPVWSAIPVLGNGSGISAQDTVAFTLWCAAQHLDDYAAALWLTVSGLGDIDTNCAIVGGIVAAYTGAAGIPAEWRQRREPLPDWTFTEGA